MLGFRAFSNNSYDDLDRLVLKDLPGSEVSVAYAYDYLNRLTSATQGITVTVYY